MRLPCVVYNMPDEHFDGMAALFRRTGMQEEMSIAIEARSNDAERLAGIIQEMNGICLLVVYVPSLVTEEGKNAIRLGRLAIAHNRDHYVVYCAANRQALIEMAPYCHRPAGMLLADTLTRRGERMMQPILRDYKQLMKAAALPEETSFLSLKTKASVMRVPMNSIVALLSANKSVEVHLNNGTMLSTNTTLEKLMEQLNESFIVCHRGCVINQECIQYMDCQNMELVLTNDLRVPIARAFKKAIKGKLGLGNTMPDREPELKEG